MKKSFPKKLLSLMLAALMVVTSIPMFAVTASAAATTVVNETPCFEVNFMDSSIYGSATYAGANPTINAGNGYTIGSGMVPNGDGSGFAEYNSAGLKLVNGYADCGIAKGTLGSNFRIVLRANISSPMDTHERAIIALGSNGSWNNILSWTCGEIHVLSPGTVGGTAGDGTFDFSSLGAVYQNNGSFDFMIEMLNGTLTLKNNDITLFTQENCGINGADIDYIRIFDDDSWWGGYGTVEYLGLYNLSTATCDTAALGSDIQYETTGYVEMDPVIYVHGTSSNTGTNNELAVYNTLGFYDYMMHGDRIADATVLGERETNVFIKGGKQLKYVYVTDTNQRIDVVGGALKGTMGGAYGTVTTTTTDSTATLCFVFTDGSAEYRKVAVKTNPVAQHIAAVNGSYTGGWTSKKFRSASIKMVALGSYGVTESSNSYNYPVMYNWSTTMNYWNYNKAADMSGKKNNVLTVDKKAGLMNSAYSSSDTAFSTTFSSARAQYYVDLSTDYRSNGFNFNEADNSFSLKFFVGDIYVNQDSDEQGGTYFAGTTGALNSVVLNMTSDGDLAKTGTGNTWNQKTEKRGFVTVSGTLPATGAFDGHQNYTITHATASPYCSVVADINYRINVVDKSSLRDVFDAYTALQLDSRCYTAESWAAYKSAMLSADSFLNNYQADASDQGSFKSALETAKNNLTPKTDVSAHTFGASTVINPTCTAQGYTTQTCTRCGYEYKSNYTAETGHTYVYTPVADQFKHTITCQKGDLPSTTEDCVDNDNNGQCDKCLQSLLANWTNYNQKVAEFKAAIQGKTFTQAKINEINNKLGILIYYNMTDAQKAAVTATYQTAINNEAKQLATFIPTEADEIDTQVADDAVKTDIDTDQYDEEIYNAFVQNYVISDATVGGVACKSVPYASQTALDNAAKAALESVKEYDITLNNATVATKVPYGTPVVVDGSGNVYKNVADINTDYGSVPYSWYYSCTSPNTSAASEKYITNSVSLGFVVKGNTALRKEGAASDNCYSVVVKENIKNKVIAVLYTDAAGNFTLPEAPEYAYYSCDGYSGGFTPGTQHVNGNTVITAMYSIDPSAVDYDINYYSYDSTYFESLTAGYNEKVTITAEINNFYCWAQIVDPDAEDWEYEVLSYEPEYSFYAYKNMEIFELSIADINEMRYNGENVYYGDHTLINTSTKAPTSTVFNSLVPVYSGDTKEKVVLIGTAAVAPTSTVIEAGFLVARSSGNKAAKYFTVENCTNKVSRYKVSQFTCGKQFVTNIVLDGAAIDEIDYCSYAIVEDSNGNRDVVYSSICRNVAV